MNHAPALTTPCRYTDAERHYDGGGTMTEQEIAEKQAAIAARVLDMRENPDLYDICADMTAGGELDDFIRNFESDPMEAANQLMKRFDLRAEHEATQQWAQENAA